ncbi:PD40 domain-containing protein [Cellvibrio sp. PSBB023]|uniref:HzsA-related protein n=1 Tax=Cellvibrio sp. PSBB023 TaxID=1945512 RepID=UPI00098F3A13|nr:PD40 domain-containing protein [Cellvibrio sp. PSBB023]AQT60789.1 hypothetical protein B0D95_12390 [Cellvibrio sp. PSBB023]
MTQFVTPSYFLSRWLVLGSLLALTACGGGSSGGGSNGGQAPDPVVVDIPVAYIQRPLPVDEDGEPVYPDVFMPDSFNPGGELYVKARATTQAEVVNITRSAFENDEFFDAETPNYDVKDVAAHPDGKRLVFAMHAPLNPDLDEDDPAQPTWNIWEYNLATKQLRRVISSTFEAEKGDDVSPRYLPDGRILFSSNRQKRSKEILLDEGKPQFGAVTQQDNDITSFLLHSVKDDGTDIQQLSYHLSHDLQPQVMPNGRLVFLRWSGERLSFYSANPDGTDVQRYFGDASLNPEELPEGVTEVPRLLRPQVLPDGRLAAIYVQNGLQLGGDMVVVDGAAALEGQVQSLSIKPVNIATDLVSLHGRFASLSPLYDGTNRLLVSWSQCRLLETATERLQPCLPTLLVDGVPVAGYEEAPPFYGLWIYDLNNQTQLPVVLAENDKVFTEALALEQNAYNPTYIAPATDPDLAARNLGLLHIRSVYDLDGAFNAMNSGAADLQAMIARPVDQRPARFIRLVKAVSRADDDTLDDQDDNIYGNLFNANNGIQEILGYAPVEADGSVMVTVPADVAFSLEILDRNGRQISANHNTYLQLRPGEKMTCNGCHAATNTTAVHGRKDLEASALNNGSLGINFPNTQRYLPLGIFVTPSVGETMAEFAARSTYCEDPLDGTTCYDMAGPGQERNLRNPNVDLFFRDEWAAPGVPRAETINIEYNALIPGANADQIPAPTPEACREESSWNANCRVVINYEYHIQPLWERERDPMTVTDPELMIDKTANTCVACHSPTDADGNLQVPSAQLNLLRTKENANSQMRAYLQLLNGNQRQIQFIYEGSLAVLLPVCEFEDNYDFIPQCDVLLDDDGVPTCEGVANCPFEIANEETGELQLDAMGNPVPRMVNTGFLPPPMSRGGARASGTFFNKFENNGTHMGFLNAAELKLLSEWLDTNGRYYTNPFELALPN